MGFATNTTGIPQLVNEKGTLILSDSDNHASIILGTRHSKAKVIVFPHNDIVKLEKILRESIAKGQPRTRRPWKKIIILVEGIYSMEGGICTLPEIIKLKKKYKCYLYIDEAHSIGALGPHGRGVCDFWGVDPKDVDILMGTFTKSFGSVGGYIAADRETINYLRKYNYSNLYAVSMSPVCAQQIISAIEVITGKDGTDIGKKKIQQLRENATYFKKKLEEMGFEVIGDDGSPVLCIMLYQPLKLTCFSRLSLEKNIAVVVVGAPATDLLGARVRICLSAAHTREDLDYALAVFDEIGDFAMAKYKKPYFSHLYL
jgi:serine palmitoyltransferase